MTDSSNSSKKTARTFDFQAMLEQARAGANERSTVDWNTEIEKAKEEGEHLIEQMKVKADEAQKKIDAVANKAGNSADDDDDDDYFGPPMKLATTASTADSSDDDDDDAGGDRERDDSNTEQNSRPDQVGEIKENDVF